MRVRALCSLATVLVSLALVHAMPAERSVLITALDASGAPLTDLAPRDVSIREDGEVREVAKVERATEPLQVAVLVDSTQPPMGKQAPVRDIRAGLSAFVKAIHTASPESTIAMYEFGGAGVRTVNYTAKTADLERFVNRFFPGQRPTAVLLEAVMDAAKDIAKAKTPRRAIVCLSLGSPEVSQVQPRVVLDETMKAGAAFWAISVQGVQDSASAQAGVQQIDQLGPVREIILTNLPEATGGQRLTAVTASALESMLTRVANSLLAQYEVTYMRPDGAPVPKSIQARVARAATVLTAPWGR